MTVAIVLGGRAKLSRRTSSLGKYFAETAVRKRCSGVPSRAYSDC